MGGSIRWYELACQVARAPTGVLAGAFRINKQARCSLRAIARLHPEIGRLLDEMEAPWNMVRTIAHAPGAAAQWERAQQLLGELAEKHAAATPRRARLEAARVAALKQIAGPSLNALR